MTVQDLPHNIARGTKDHALLMVVTNLGAGGTPNLIIGKQPMQLQSGKTGITIAPGSSSPQLTITEDWFVVSGTAGTAQDYAVQLDNIK